MSVSTAAQAYPSRSGKGEGSLALSGSVVNSVTGEPIGQALVRLAGSTQRTVFSDGEGRFEFEGLSRAAAEGGVVVTAEKPGYFSQQELNGNSGAPWLSLTGPINSLVVKLVPQSVISGRVTDSVGQPIEHVPVRLTAKPLRQGRKHWESRGQQQTDEDGRYRFANLMPGTYYLAAGPGSDRMQIVAGTERPKTGYPSIYYPGVPDMASAAPIQLSAGQHAEADFSMAAGPVYQVTGSVTGYSPERGISLQLFNSSGDYLALPTQINHETGRFDVDGVPPGSYVVKAFSQAAPEQQLRAEARFSVAGNIENLHLVMGPAISIPVSVRTESRASSSQTGVASRLQGPPISVRLIPLDPASSESYSTVGRGNPGAYSVVLQNVEPGRYSVDMTPQGGWYVQSAQYAQTNLLYEDLNITSASQSYPMEIVLRDDGATVSAAVKSPDATGTTATVVAVPQPASKLAPKIALAYAGNPATLQGLAPGEYLIYAFQSADNIEYSNPEVLENYASQAAHLTLSPNQQSQVSLELIRTGDGE